MTIFCHNSIDIPGTNGVASTYCMLPRGHSGKCRILQCRSTFTVQERGMTVKKHCRLDSGHNGFHESFGRNYETQPWMGPGQKPVRW